MELMKGNPEANFLDLELMLNAAITKLQAAREFIADHQSDYKILEAIQRIEEVRTDVIFAAKREAAN